MQVTEANTEGLKRTLKVVVGADELGRRFSERLDEIKERVQLKGFRKGKVPVPHLKKMYGRSLMAEVLEQTVKETSSKAIADRNERAVMQPSYTLPEDEKEIEQVLEGKADLAYSMTFEVLPSFDLVDPKTLKLERLRADVEPDAIDKAVEQLVERSITFTPEEGRAAASGDRITMDFVGTIDGEAFEGGSGEGTQLVLGQANFIPGFEEGLIGVKAGEERDINATFPDDYTVDALKGKAAIFAVKIKEVAAPVRPAVDDTFAKTLGAEDVANLRKLVSEQIGREYDNVARMKLKRQMLAQLEKAHTFELPPSLVDSEFEFDLAPAHRDHAPVGQVVSRREQDGGGGPRRVPPHRGAPRPPRPHHRRDRREERHQDHAGRAAPRPDRAGSAFPGPGEGGIRVLREDARSARGAARTHHRGQGRRLRHRKGQADREDGVEGRAV